MVDLPSINGQSIKQCNCSGSYTYTSWTIGMIRQLMLFQNHFLFLYKIQRTKNLLLHKALMMYISFFESLEFNGITLRKTGGSHGTLEMYANPVLAQLAGDAMGVIF